MKAPRIFYVIFFALLLLIGWLIYPRADFLAGLYEGAGDYETAERVYLGYLSIRPYNKTTTLNLVNLYYKMGQPEKATDYLRRLTARRYRDWDVANIYLTHLRHTHQMEDYYREALRISRLFLDDPQVHQRQIEAMLNRVLQYALWHQDAEAVEETLAALMPISSDPETHSQTRMRLALASRDSARVIHTLREEIKDDPDRIDLRLHLAEFLLAIRQYDGALTVVNMGLHLHPDLPDFLKIRALIYQKINKLDLAVADTQRLIELSP